MAAGSEGKGWSRLRGEREKAAAFQPQRPEMACGWVREQVGPAGGGGQRAELCSPDSSRYQCGCATRTFSLSSGCRRCERTGSLVSGGQGRPCLDIGEKGLAFTPASGGESLSHGPGGKALAPAGRGRSIPKSAPTPLREVKAPEQPDSLAPT